MIELPKAFRPLLQTSARYKGYRSGRGCAKSRSFSAAAVILAGQAGWRFLCCREYQKSIRDSVKQLIDDRIVEWKLTDFFRSTQTEVSARSGGGFLFEGLHANPQGIRSKEGVDCAWIEEASTTSQTSLDILIPTIRKPKSELWFSYNPQDPNDPVDKLLRDEEEMTEFDKKLAADSGYEVWKLLRHVTIADNPFFPDVLRSEMERDRMRDPDRYAHIWMGGYQKISQSRVFRNWKVGAYEVPPGARPYYGADWGFAVDPTVLVRCYVFPEKRLLYIEKAISRSGVEIDKTPEFFDSLADGTYETDPLHPRKWPCTADSARPETISYMIKHGYPKMTGARKGPGSVEEGVEFLKSYDILIHPNCRCVIDEFTLYSYEIDKHTNEVLPELADRENNTVDAVRYAVESLRRSVKMVRPVIVTQPISFFGDNHG